MGPRQQALGKLLSYVTDTGVGEIFDILLGSRDIGRVTREEIELTYLLKTTRYTFEAPCVIGALLAGASPEKAEDLAKVMEPLGLAFQIQNDLLEVSHLDGKDQLLPTDLMEGKRLFLFTRPISGWVRWIGLSCRCVFTLLPEARHLFRRCRIC